LTVVMQRIFAMYDTETWTMFVQSASILLREGLEVILILSALIAYLLKSGARQHLSSLCRRRDRRSGKLRPRDDHRDLFGRRAERAS